MYTFKVGDNVIAITPDRKLVSSVYKVVNIIGNSITVRKIKSDIELERCDITINPEHLITLLPYNEVTKILYAS